MTLVLQSSYAQDSNSNNYETDHTQIVNQIQNLTKQVNEVHSNIKKIEQLKSDIQKLRNDLTNINKTVDKTKNLDSKCNACIKQTDPKTWDMTLTGLSILSITLGFLGGLGGWHVSNRSKSSGNGKGGSDITKGEPTSMKV